MKVFVNDAVNNINILDERIDLEFILDIINILSNHRDSQIKIYDRLKSHYLLMINPNGPEEWKIDHPIEQNKIHKQCYATKEQCIAIIKELFKKGHIDDIPGFIEVPIRHFTLDEMLAFKKEDDMMLRGEDPDLYKPTPTLSMQSEVLKQKETQKKKPQHSFVVGEKPTITKEPTKSTPVLPVFEQNKPKTSPLQEFKKETTPKEDIPLISKTATQTPVKKENTPEPPKTKIASSTNAEKIVGAKKETSKTPLQSEPKIATPKKSDDNSFFSI
ncbi:hypothetical protein GCM10022393_23370 [Aquimarina addita]|uniref:Uncharacterized protein n=1 Tax=Aquimarina addita TaxID=870485 RepID=A0ABP6UJN3_9FLAO